MRYLLLAAMRRMSSMGMAAASSSALIVASSCAAVASVRARASTSSSDCFQLTGCPVPTNAWNKSGRRLTTCSPRMAPHECPTRMIFLLESVDADTARLQSRPQSVDPEPSRASTYRASMDRSFRRSMPPIRSKPVSSTVPTLTARAVDTIAGTATIRPSARRRVMLVFTSER